MPHLIPTHLLSLCEVFLDKNRATIDCPACGNLDSFRRDSGHGLRGYDARRYKCISVITDPATSKPKKCSKTMGLAEFAEYCQIPDWQVAVKTFKAEATAFVDANPRQTTSPRRGRRSKPARSGVLIPPIRPTISSSPQPTTNELLAMREQAQVNTENGWEDEEIPETPLPRTLANKKRRLTSPTESLASPQSSTFSPASMQTACGTFAKDIQMMQRNLKEMTKLLGDTLKELQETRKENADLRNRLRQVEASVTQIRVYQPDAPLNPCEPPENPQVADDPEPTRVDTVLGRPSFASVAATPALAESSSITLAWQKIREVRTRQRREFLLKNPQLIEQPRPTPVRPTSKVLITGIPRQPYSDTKAILDLAGIQRNWVAAYNFVGSRHLEAMVYSDACQDFITRTNLIPTVRASPCEGPTFIAIEKEVSKDLLQSIFKKEATRLDYLVERSNAPVSELFKRIREDFLLKSNRIMDFLQENTSADISRQAIQEWFRNGPPPSAIPDPSLTIPQEQPTQAPEAMDQ